MQWVAEDMGRFWHTLLPIANCVGLGRPGIDVSVCSACGGPMGMIAESRTTALKIRWSLAK